MLQSLIPPHTANTGRIVPLNMLRIKLREVILLYVLADSDAQDHYNKAGTADQTGPQKRGGVLVH